MPSRFAPLQKLSRKNPLLRYAPAEGRVKLAEGRRML